MSILSSTKGNFPYGLREVWISQVGRISRRALIEGTVCISSIVVREGALYCHSMSMGKRVLILWPTHSTNLNISSSRGYLSLCSLLCPGGASFAYYELPLLHSPITSQECLSKCTRGSVPRQRKTICWAVQAKRHSTCSKRHLAHKRALRHQHQQHPEHLGRGQNDQRCEEQHHHHQRQGEAKQRGDQQDGSRCHWKGSASL